MVSNQTEREHRWYKYRNKYGEVVACVCRSGWSETGTRKFLVGFAFSNPEDFSLPRSIRVQKGHGISYRRMMNEPVEIDVELPKEGLDNSKVYEIVKKYLISVWEDGFDDGKITYHSKLNIGTYEGWSSYQGDFVVWFDSFIRVLKGTKESIDEVQGK